MSPFHHPLTRAKPTTFRPQRKGVRAPLKARIPKYRQNRSCNRKGNAHTPTSLAPPQNDPKEGGYPSRFRSFLPRGDESDGFNLYPAEVRSKCGVRERSRKPREACLELLVHLQTSEIFLQHVGQLFEREEAVVIEEPGQGPREDAVAHLLKDGNGIQAAGDD